MIERVAIEVDGTGEAVLCLHGLGGSSNTFAPLMSTLARSKTIRIDLPGSSRSWRAETALSIHAFVACAKRVLQHFAVSKVHVIGHSLGSIVAQHLAATEPTLVRSLCLFGPLLAPPDSARANIRTRGLKARSEGIPGMQDIADAISQASTSSETKQRRPAAHAFVRESLMRQDPESYGNTCEALADAQAADTSKILCPVWLVTGEEDIVAPPQSVRQMATKFSTARIEVLRGCGHWPTIEKPEECNDIVRQFLSQRIT